MHNQLYLGQTDRFVRNAKESWRKRKFGLFFGKVKWLCPICGSTFPMPKGDVKEMVEKNLAAYLRKKGELS
jgi:hypothetical protein